MLVWVLVGFSTIAYNETLVFLLSGNNVVCKLLQLWTPSAPTPPQQRTEEDDILISAVSVWRAYRVYKERPLYLHISAWQVSISKEGGKGGYEGVGGNTKRIATVPYIVWDSISYNKYGSFLCQFQVVYFVLMAKVTIVWLTVANIWRNVLAKYLAVVPQM